MSIIELSKSIVRGATPAPVFEDLLAGDPSCEPRILKVLIVDACTQSGALIEAMVRHVARFEPHITRVTTSSAARFALAADHFDAVIADFDLAGEVLATIGKNSRTSVIVVAEHLTLRMSREASANGAVACFSKDNVSPKLIEAAVLGEQERR